MQTLTNVRLMEIIELLVAILKEAAITEERQAILDKVCRDIGGD